MALAGIEITTTLSSAANVQLSPELPSHIVMERSRYAFTQMPATRTDLVPLRRFPALTIHSLMLRKSRGARFLLQTLLYDAACVAHPGEKTVGCPSLY